ncbi:MAG: hypothetical protein JSW12_11675 [Deltaproteobacteria bacterium]|nr:MAG: hypothetical protein JSW12_11675 [Deltaproteobacteria bacterium]
MREKGENQMPPTPDHVDHPHAMEPDGIGRILDHVRVINELAWQDLLLARIPWYRSIHRF